MDKILGIRIAPSMSEGFENGLTNSLERETSEIERISEKFGAVAGYLLHNTKVTQTLALLDKVF